MKKQNYNIKTKDGILTANGYIFNTGKLLIAVGNQWTDADGTERKMRYWGVTETKTGFFLCGGETMKQAILKYLREVPKDLVLKTVEEVGTDINDGLHTNYNLLSIY